MNPHTISRNSAKFRRYSLISHLSRSRSPKKTISQKLPGQFASAMAHEVRNPLTNINLAVEMLASANGKDEQKLYLDIIKRGSERINVLVNDLLSYYRFIETESRLFSIHQLLDEVLALTEDRILLKHITIRKDYSTLDCKVLVNQWQIKIALTNIIINAIEAMPPAMGKLKLVTRSVNGKCILEIEDNGHGIPEEDLKNIFNPYVTGKPGGLGLGLSTTLDILLANHANITVRSEKGKGACFILSFDRVEKSLFIDLPALTVSYPSAV